MCLHRKSDYNKIGLAALAVGASLIPIALYNEKGTYIGGWFADADSAQDVANTIRDLKSWHGEGYADLRFVNEYRAREGMPELHEERLPAPTGEALPERADQQVDAILAEDNPLTRQKLITQAREVVHSH